MRLLQKPTRWTCIATAFAMALGIPFETMFRLIGHDGSEIIDPSRKDPLGRRGHHIQECIVAALHLGYSVTPVELFPSLDYGMGHTLPLLYGSEEGNWKQFSDLIRTTQGVITGRGTFCGHAVAYSQGYILDPDGRHYEYSREACENRGFTTQCLWRVARMEIA